ncbi:MAG: ABC transporter ATP-binding protein [Ilumatobacteraceae bacterium]
MIRRAWRSIDRYLSHPARKMVALSGASTIGGFAEAALLVSVVRAAVAVAGSNTDLGRVPVLHTEVTIPLLLWVAGACGVVSMVSNVLIARLTARMQAEVLHGVRSRVILAFTSSSWERQSTESEGSIQESVSTLSVQSAAVVMNLSSSINALLSLVVLLGVAMAQNVVATLGVVAAGLLVFAVLRPLSRLTGRRAQRFVESNSQFAEATAATNSLAMELKAFGVQDIAADRLLANSQSVADRVRSLRFAARLGSSMYRDLAAMLLVVCVAALYLTSSGALPSVGTVVVLVVRAVGTATALQGNTQQLRESVPSVDALNTRISEMEANRTHFGDRSLDRVGVVELHQVGYHYGRPAEGDDRTGSSEALAGVSLRIEPGEVIGLIGPSGSGKSTLVQILTRLRPPTSGTVTIDGVDYREISEASWASLVALVPQEPRLMRSSIADNIAFLRPGISRDEVVAAARDAHIDAEVLRLPDGFDTELGPQGGGLSGGQKQRVAIARALVGKPGLLVLDEPTSALDVRSERMLQETLRHLKGTITMVIVAHRLSTLESCDRLVVVRDGAIEMVGTPDELAARPGFFQMVSTTLIDDAHLHQP